MTLLFNKVFLLKRVTLQLFDVLAETELDILTMKRNPLSSE